MSINFHIKTKDVDLTQDISNKVHEKLSVIEKHISPVGDQEVLAEVEIGLESKHHKKGDIYRAEVNVSSDGNLYRAESNAESIDAALDALKDEIDRVIKRKKSKSIDLKRAGGRLLKKIMRR